MNPQEIFCPNMDCVARGHVGKGNIHVHSQKDKRFICVVCQQTFTTSKGTIFYRLRTDPQIVMWVIALLAYGCPVQAIVKAFELDERTVRDWQERAGAHCRQIHVHFVEHSQQDLQQVQADEIKVKTQKGYYWMALAMAGVQNSRITDGRLPNCSPSKCRRPAGNCKLFAWCNFPEWV
jgi:transposase-like protein